MPQCNAKKRKIDEVSDQLSYLISQQERVKPVLDSLSNILIDKIDEESLTCDKAFEMFKFLNEFYTNSSILIIKSMEVLNGK